MRELVSDDTIESEAPGVRVLERVGKSEMIPLEVRVGED